MSDDINSGETSKDPNPNEWARKVVENLIEAEKKWVELISQQNALALKAIREALDNYRSAPTPGMADWVRQGIENFVEAQRNWAENSAKQLSRFYRIEQERAESEIADDQPTSSPDIAAAASTLSGFVQKQMESMVEARKNWLDTAAKQNATYLNNVKQTLGLDSSASASAMVDWSQKQVENYVEMQKRWLNLATQLPFQGPSNRR